MIQPPHPGETIREDSPLPLGMSVTALAKQLGIGTARLNEIVRGERGISADTALRLARYFDTSAEFWRGLQLEYDLRIAQQNAGKLIARQVKTRKQAAYPQGLASPPPDWPATGRECGWARLAA